MELRLVDTNDLPAELDRFTEAQVTEEWYRSLDNRDKYPNGSLHNVAWRNRAEVIEFHLETLRRKS